MVGHICQQLDSRTPGYFDLQIGEMLDDKVSLLFLLSLDTHTECLHEQRPLLAILNEVVYLESILHTGGDACSQNPLYSLTSREGG